MDMQCLRRLGASVQTLVAQIRTLLNLSTDDSSVGCPTSDLDSTSPSSFYFSRVAAYHCVIVSTEVRTHFGFAGLQFGRNCGAG